MANIQDTIYTGIKGTVLALDRATGAEIWRTELKGSGFVNLTLDGEQLVATTKGEVFCLDAATGQLRWNSTLSGLGLGLVSIVTSRAPNSSFLNAEKIVQDQQAAAASAAVIAST